MTGAGAHTGEQWVDADLFVVVECEEDFCSFVSIDEDASYDAIVIDISQDDLYDTISVDFETDDFETDSFVRIDEDQIFVSDFTENDLLIDFNLI